MDKIIVEVCAGTHCTMMGAMNIMDAVASLSEIRKDMEPCCEVEVRPIKCMDLCKNGSQGPFVTVNGALVERAESDAVMAAIMQHCSGHRKAGE
ncbi:MAG: DUF1450 domain-containing protein [Clostridiales bacterium]|nr:DUF1450 domain-containing protein [Clostridiales bacterium]